MPSQGSNSGLSLGRDVLRVLNSTTEVIPPRAAMMIVDCDDDDVFSVQKPNADNLGTVIFNGPTPIAAGERGTAINVFPCPAAFSYDNEAGAAPNVGESWGTVAGEWYLFQDYAGFRVVRDGMLEAEVMVIRDVVTRRNLSYRLGLTLAAIPALSGGVLGSGPVMFYTIDSEDKPVTTGVSGVVKNKCAEIAVGNLVDIFIEPDSQKKLASNPCEFTDPVFAAPCAMCESVQSTYCIVIAGVTSASTFPWICLDCSVLARLTVTRVGTTCVWVGSFNICDTLNSGGSTGLGTITFVIRGNLAQVSIAYDGAGPIVGPLAAWEADVTDWDCDSNLEMAFDFAHSPSNFPSVYCTNYPLTITVYPGDCPDCSGLTVSFDDDNLDVDAPTVTISGTGFDGSTPGNNLVTFDRGAVGVCTASTTTTLTVTFSTQPTTTGALTAVVTVGECSSGDAVQVATAVTGHCGCDLPGCMLLSAVGSVDCACIATPITCVLTTADGFLWTGTLVATGCPGSPSAAVSLQCLSGVWNLAIGATSAPMVVNDCETLNMTATLLGWATSCTNSDSRVDVTITQTSCGGGDGSTCADAAVESANVLFERTYATGVDAWIKIAKTPITNYSITIAYVSGDVPSIEVYDGDDCAGKTLTDTISYSHAGRCVDETGGAGAFWWLKITAPASDTVLDLTVSTTPC